MFHSIANCLKTPDLKSRMLCTIALLAIFALAILMFPQKIFLFLGKSFEVTLFGDIARALSEGDALGIMPYISAAIVISLLIVIIVAVKKMARPPSDNPPR